MSEKLLCRIPPTPVFYEIEMWHDLIKQGKIISDSLRTLGNHFAIVTDTNIEPLYGKFLLDTLVKNGLKAYLFSIPAGESFKTRQTKESLEDQLLTKSLGRDTCIIALGGGVVTDIAGFLASSYCRGVPLVMIPTTLLGMVDACIGGKNGVNTSFGKNLIGSIYQPRKVLIDPSLLTSLPKNELRNGVVEMIKHGLIADLSYFEFLENHSAEILALDPLYLERAIRDSCQIKIQIVEKDERENGLRRLLNYGHTIGHALENLSQYRLSHGEAVAIGMLVESHMAVQMGILAPHVLERTQKILQSYQLPLKLPEPISHEELLKQMIHDKKAFKSVPRFTLIRDIGFPHICNGHFCTSIDEQIIINAIKWMNHDLCRH